MPHIRLIAASDDYLLEERMAAAVAEVCDSLGGVEPEVVSDDATPESVATELVSPSLFADRRVLVVRDARDWLGAAAPAGAAGSGSGDDAPDPRPLVHVLGEGVPDEIGLVIGAWCGRRPTGALVDAVEATGTFEWIPVPPPPKPWENTTLSGEQRRVLESVLVRAAAGVAFDAAATGLLLERLGFAPRLLVQEVRKLSGAAGAGGVDEALVRQLTFPRERSLEVVRDAVLERRIEPLLDLVAAAGAGEPINDWRGQRVEPGGLGAILLGQVSNLQLQMLYLRRLAERTGLGEEMAPERTAHDRWYNTRFKSGLAPKLLDEIKNDAPSPLLRPGGKPPTPFTLGKLFAGAGRYSDDELTAAVAAAGGAEVGIRRQPLLLETLTAWLCAFIGRGSR